MNFDLTTPQIVTLLVDFAPFALYSVLLIKLLTVWLRIRKADSRKGQKYAAVLLIGAVVVSCFLAANVYSIAVYGKTVMSIRGFQTFVLGNWIFFWLLIDLLTPEVEPTQGPPCEPTD